MLEETRKALKLSGEDKEKLKGGNYGNPKRN
jgi:hypothetical protein